MVYVFSVAYSVAAVFNVAIMYLLQNKLFSAFTRKANKARLIRLHKRVSINSLHRGKPSPEAISSVVRVGA